MIRSLGFRVILQPTHHTSWFPLEEGYLRKIRASRGGWWSRDPIIEASQEPSSPATFWIPRVTDQGLSEALLRNGTHCKQVPLDEMAMCWPTTGAGEGLQNCFVIDTAMLVFLNLSFDVFLAGPHCVRITLKVQGPK